MPRERQKLPPWFRSHGLAACCVVAPLLLAFLGFNGALYWISPDIANQIAINYAPAEPTPPEVGKPPATETTDKTTGAATTAAPGGATEAAKSQPSQKSATTKPATADPSLFLRGLEYRGEAQYAMGSALIYLVSAAVLVFSLVVVYQHFQVTTWFSSLLAFTATGLVIGYHLPKPRGRELVVENLLNHAETFPTMKLDGVAARGTGDIVSSLVSFNTVAALVPVGMLLMALAALSIRNISSTPTRADLMQRRNCLRIALGLGSALFVIGVLANKTLVDWPLSLVTDSQRLALQPIADAVTLQLATMGTIAILAAFSPAITAWWLDVQIYEDDIAARAKKAKAETKLIPMPRPEPVDDAPAAPDTDASDKKTTGEFAFAPLSMITGIMAALAPLLASPFADALKSVLGVLAKASP